jgi:hypothetical protein
MPWLAALWFIWIMVLGQQLYLRFFGIVGNVTTENPGLSIAARALLLTPLAVSIVVRVLALPRMSAAIPYTAVYLLGIIPAGMAGLPNLFLEVPHRQAKFWVCIAVIVSFVPLRFPRRSEPDRRPESS